MDKNWNTNYPIKYLPRRISNLFSYEANFLYYDLKSNTLQVELFPAPEIRHIGHKVRKVTESNPVWYKKVYEENSFEATYQSRRTKRKRRCLCSRVSRQKSLESLQRISNKKDLPNIFHDCLYRNLIFDKFYYGEDYSGIIIPPKKSFLRFFDGSGRNYSENFNSEFYEDFGFSSVEEFEDFYGFQPI